MVSASVIFSTPVVRRRRVTPLVSGMISGRPGPARVTAVAAPVASTRVFTIGSARITSFVAPRGVHLVLVELLELPAVADVMGVPSVEEAVRFAGVTDVVFAFAKKLGFWFSGEHRRLFTFVFFCFAFGVWRGRG